MHSESIMDKFFDEAKVERAADREAGPVLTFDEPRSLTLSIRASALVFEDPASQRLLTQIQLVAPSDATVLITGETVTGKELVARHIHALSKRRQEVFGALNCAALSETLIESELFAHEKGSFTGARKNTYVVVLSIWITPPYCPTISSGMNPNR